MANPDTRLLGTVETPLYSAASSGYVDAVRVLHGAKASTLLLRRTRGA